MYLFSRASEASETLLHADERLIVLSFVRWTSFLLCLALSFFSLSLSVFLVLLDVNLGAARGVWISLWWPARRRSSFLRRPRHPAVL